MATRIRLRRVGRKGIPLYRIVVSDKDSPRDGRFVAAIGTYDPRAEQAADKVKLDAEQARAWLAKGATPTDTVRAILERAGLLTPAKA
ncbi:MAG TPA: 30S ribosomal protein S16 [Gemmatimonadales bacterium]|nr:30S ribosomal protein S16 [Gemmatimonadales bacterium]